VVTDLANGNSCQSAGVDAQANQNVTELPGEAARRAGDYDCSRDEVAIIGALDAY